MKTTPPNPLTVQNLNVFTVAEAAAYLRMSIKTVARRIADGSLQVSRIAGAIRIERTDIERLLAKTKVEAPTVMTKRTRKKPAGMPSMRPVKRNSSGLKWTMADIKNPTQDTKQILQKSRATSSLASGHHVQGNKK